MSNTTLEKTLGSSSSLKQIKGQIGDDIIAFPSPWVLDIIIVERSKFLCLPFYPKSLLGIAYHHSKLVPFVYLDKTLPEASSSPSLSHHVMGVRLSAEMGELHGVAVIIDRLFGDAQDGEHHSAIEFNPSDLSPQLWKPMLGQTSLS